MIGPRRHQILAQAGNGATINSSGNSGTLTNLDQDVNAPLIVMLAAQSMTSGATLTVSVYSVDDAGNKYLLGTVAITPAALTNRAAYTNVIEPSLYFSWAITGTSPSASGVDLNAYMTSPNS